MKKLSLRWRLTLTTALLVAAACLLLNLLISRSAIMHIDEIGDYIVEIEPAGQEPLVIGMEGSDLSAQVQQAKDTFRIQSALVTLVIILLGSIFTWFLAGRGAGAPAKTQRPYGGRSRPKTCPSHWKSPALRTRWPA